MTEKIHKTHFPVTKDVPWKRPITISYITLSGKICGMNGCENPADYMAEGKIYCTFHWTKLGDEK